MNWYKNMTYVYPYLPSMTLSISNIQFNYDFQYKIQLIYNVFAKIHDSQ